MKTQSPLTFAASALLAAIPILAGGCAPGPGAASTGTLSSSVSSPVPAPIPLAGVDKGGNGGDTYASEYVGIAHEIAAALARYEENTNSKVLSDTGFKLVTFNALLKKLEVDSIDGDLYLGGIQKDAISYSASDKTLLSIPRWKGMDSDAKQRLVMHEMCVNMGLEVTNKYALSQELLAIADQNMENVIEIPVTASSGDDKNPCSESLRRAAVGLFALNTPLAPGESFYAGVDSGPKTVKTKESAETIYEVQVVQLFDDGTPYDGYDIYEVTTDSGCDVLSVKRVYEN